MKKTMTQHGFTMIELMIAMALGLIIIAAAVGVYLANYRNLATQRSGSEMQSASMFGIQPLESRLRLANLGNDTKSGGINDVTADGGIVLASANASAVTDTSLHSNTGTGSSNTATGSDQLTIQFTNATGFVMYDCEGNEVTQDAKSIERYFVRSNASGDLVLACDAGTFSGNTLSNFGDDGVDLVSNVDLFRYLVGVQTLTNSGVAIRFYTADDYKALTGDKPAIVMIRAGVIASGSTPMTDSEGLSEFTLLGQSETLNADVSTNFVRNTFETTTLLRNARNISYTTQVGTGININ